MIILAFINLAILLCTLIVVKTTFTRLYVSALLFVSILITSGGLANNDLIYQKALLFLISSNFFVMIVSFITCKVSLNKHAYAIIKKRDKQNLIKLYIFSFSSLYLLIQASGGIQNIFSSWIIVKQAVEGEGFLRNASIFMFLISLMYLRKLEFKERKIILLTLPPIISLLLFVLVLRVKLFIVPLLFVIFLPRNSRILKLATLGKVFVGFLLSYILVMFVRWLGDVSSIDSGESSEIFANVMDAGIEREMYHQFISVFEYYMNHQIHYGEAYFRIVWEPINRIFNLGQSIPNPMYFYYTIANDFVVINGGSAHPSLYADSFASFGFIGVFVPAIWLLLISITENYIYKSNGELLFVALSLSIPLLVRGSIYYAILYFLILLLLWLFLNGKRIIN